MKKLLIVVALGFFGFVSADQYNPASTGNEMETNGNYKGSENYQDQSNKGNNYQQNPRQNSQGNYQNDNRNYQKNNHYERQTQPQSQSPRNLAYEQNQEQGNQTYDRSQQRKDETYSESQLQTSEKKYPQDFASNAQDRQVNAKIRNELSGGWFSKGYETLVIRTTNGIVVITGTVDKPEDIQKVNEKIKGIEGVRSVNSQLNVKNR